MKLLTTGGAGYIASHAIVAFLNAGFEVIALDNLSNSKENVFDAIFNICKKRPIFIKGDILDKALLARIFSEHKISAVLHFAGLKAVGESVLDPLRYYHNNVSGTITLLQIMQDFGINKIIFSSSATVYGAPEILPIDESAKAGNTTNPYGTSKYIVEQILKDICAKDSSFCAVALRYANPIGAHPSGLIGEYPNGVPNNLMPYLLEVATKKRDELVVFGDDYPTKDGSGVRDYIHVVDLVNGHLKALSCQSGFHIYNLGTGSGYSVFEIINAFCRVNNVEIPFKVAKRRDGDIACIYLDPSKVKKELGFKAELSLEDMMKDSWNFIRNIQNEGDMSAGGKNGS
ncbi:MAG: UDP-glucose 4-epimerase GalE [Helicobacter sp.]|nr:UDP-glucose 4-epimerase GalE [Helicobacter sp.]